MFENKFSIVMILLLNISLVSIIPSKLVLVSVNFYANYASSVYSNNVVTSVNNVTSFSITLSSGSSVILYALVTVS